MSTNTPRRLLADPPTGETVVCYDCEQLGYTCPDCLRDFMDGEPAAECAHLITVEYRNRQRECVGCGSVAQ